jgi:hypothetical protein
MASARVLLAPTPFFRRGTEIRELQNEIADLRRKESEAHQALTQSNQTIKTSTELGDVERAWVTANAAVATRNNIATRIAGIEKSGFSAGCLDFYLNQVKINLRKLTLNSFTNRLKIEAKVKVASAVEGDGAANPGNRSQKIC